MEDCKGAKANQPVYAETLKPDVVPQRKKRLRMDR
ncbi:hypothetical protein LEMLEM_LOCUS11150 [Lemmus lemmus]